MRLQDLETRLLNSARDVVLRLTDAEQKRRIIAGLADMSGDVTFLIAMLDQGNDAMYRVAKQFVHHLWQRAESRALRNVLEARALLRPTDAVMKKLALQLYARDELEPYTPGKPSGPRQLIDLCRSHYGARWPELEDLESIPDVSEVVDHIHLATLRASPAVEQQVWKHVDEHVRFLTT